LAAAGKAGNHLVIKKVKLNSAMNKLILLCLSCLAMALAGCQINGPASAPQHVTNGKQYTYVLVHGAWGGGWDWKTVDHMLTADGHTVYRATLTGQGEHSNLSSTNIDLETHIQDVVNLILWEDLHDVVLVGHSYGGMVITGVADRVPDRIKHLVYLDALLPENGECVTNATGKSIRQPIKDGFIIAPWVTGNPPPPHDVPMPLLTFTQPIILTNQAVAGKLPVTYILTVDAGKTPDQDDFYKFYLRAKARGWPALTMEGDHNVQRSHRQELVKLLEEAP
jgi:pimeloyl-ACP methyl ester carboxylesterase